MSVRDDRHQLLRKMVETLEGMAPPQTCFVLAVLFQEPGEENHNVHYVANVRRSDGIEMIQSLIVHLGMKN